MKKNSLIKIIVKNPCQQNWDEMDSTSQHRFCKQCNKEVVDFTLFSDRELYSYFQSHSNICGRIYTDQTNRHIFPSENKTSYWSRFAGIIAGLISFIASKSMASIPQKKLTITEQQPIEIKQKNSSNIGISDTTIIKGKLIDKDRNAINGGIIMWEGKQVAKSDINGEFTFIPVITNQSKSYLIKFSYPDMENTVRSYHPAMGNTEYKVTLLPPQESQRIIMGGITTEENIEFPILKFSYNNSKLTDDNKAVLATTGMILRNHPFVSIELTGGGKTPSEISRAKEFLNSIKKYLVDKEGISSERIKINKEINSNLIKIIEIKTCRKE